MVVDPIVLGATHSILHLVLSRVLGKASSYSFETIEKAVFQHVRNLSLSDNMELQTAFWGASLRAGLDVCGIASEAIERQKTTLERASDSSSGDPAHIWLRAAKTRIKHDLGHLRELVARRQFAIRELAPLMTGDGGPHPATQMTLRKALEDTFLEYLSSVGEPIPVAVQERVHADGDSSSSVGSESSSLWFDLTSQYFLEKIKTDPKVKTVFEGQILADLSLEGVKVDLTRFEDLLEVMRSEIISRIEGINTALNRRSSTNLGIGEKYAGREVSWRVEQRTKELRGPLYGREEELKQLDEFLNQRSRGVMLMMGPGGQGKSALLAHWIHSRQKSGACFVSYFFSTQLRQIDSALYSLCKQLFSFYGLADQPIPPSTQIRDTMFGLVQDKGATKQKPLVIVIDALDEAEDEFRPPLPTHRSGWKRNCAYSEPTIHISLTFVKPESVWLRQAKPQVC
jgi:hypothetical protein